MLFYVFQDFRNVALLGKLKLEINEQKFTQATKKKENTTYAFELLFTSDDDSGDEFTRDDADDIGGNLTRDDEDEHGDDSSEKSHGFF